MSDELMTVAKAAAAVGSSQTRLREWIRAGELPAVTTEEWPHLRVYLWDVKQAKALRGVTLPAEPLKALLRREALRAGDKDGDTGHVEEGLNNLQRMGIVTNVARMMRSETVTLELADDICCRLGHHLSQVYGRTYYTAIGSGIPRRGLGDRA